MKAHAESAASPYPALPCACAQLRRATRAVTALYDAELRSAGLRATQFTLLQVLALRPGMGQSRLSEALALDSTTLSRSLALLVRRGWILAEEGADRRERLWRLTPAGRRKLSNARPAWERAQQRLRRQLTGPEWSGLQDTLTRVLGAAGTADTTRREKAGTRRGA